MLNAVDAVAIVFTLAFSLFNFYKIVIKQKMHSFFIWAFYLLVIFCLASWEITAIAQAVKPDTRYLVFQLKDKPKYFHYTADLSDAAYIGLFALISSTIHHVSQSLTFLVPTKPGQTPITAETIKRKIKVYNIIQLSIFVVYISLFLIFFFDPWNDFEEASLVLGIYLGIRALLIVIYIFTVI